MASQQSKLRLTNQSHLRDLEVRWCAPVELKEDPRNPRLHKRDQIDKLKRSTEEFGFTNPILVDEAMTIICGHGRKQAWIEMDLELVPYIVLSDLTEAQRLAYMMADNAIAEQSGWSKEMLRDQLQGLIDLGYDTELTGFDTVEIDTLLSYDETGDSDEDEVGAAEDAVEEPRSGPTLARLGDHWIIGRHHLLVADARDITSYEALLGDKRARCAFLDPPFNVSARHISGNGKVKHGSFVMGSAELSPIAFEQGLLRQSFRNIARFCLPGAIAFVCSDWRCLRPIWDAAEGVFVEPKNLVTWAKTNAGMGSFYRSQTEYVVPFLVSKGHTVNNMQLAPGKRHRSTLWTYPGANTFRAGRMEDLADHPTVKPRKMIADALLDVSKPGDIVLDTFLGSGSTLSAAEVTGRIGYGLELDPKFADVILRRLAALTGEAPQLEDGTPITAVATSRDIDWKG